MSRATTLLSNAILHRPALAQPRHFWRRILQALQVQKSRHRLAQLQPHQLADIGLTQSEARLEAKRAPWDAPQIWRRAD